MRRFATLLCLGCGILPAQTADTAKSTNTPAAGQPSFSVIYTGRMLGYFRGPNEQQADVNASATCPSLEGLNNPAREFTKMINSFKSGKKGDRSELVVSMGDNFAPQLLSRTLAETRADGKYHFGKDNFTWDYTQTPPRWIRNPKPGTDLSNDLAAGISEIAIDNVACFIQAAGFDALVPGKHDFYFGPERLRQLARLLAKSDVQMLGASVTLASTVVDQAPRLPEDQKKGMSARNLPVKVTEVTRLQTTVVQ